MMKIRNSFRFDRTRLRTIFREFTLDIGFLSAILVTPYHLQCVRIIAGASFQLESATRRANIERLVLRHFAIALGGCFGYEIWRCDRFRRHHPAQRYHHRNSALFTANTPGIFRRPTIYRGSCPSMCDR